MELTTFNNELVNKVSNFIQTYMHSNNIDFLTADQCADILSKNNILKNTVGPKPGFNFRQLLRDGRDGHINLVVGAQQVRPRTKWIIHKK